MAPSRDRAWLREARCRVLWPSRLSIYRSWMKDVVELTALRAESDLEPLDVLLSFGRYERVLALLDGAGPEIPARELMVRKAVCLCLLGRDGEARRTLIEASSRSQDPVLAFATAWLAKLRGWEIAPPVSAGGGLAEFDWLLAARFDARPPPLDEARATRWAQANWLFAEDRKQSPLPDLAIGPRYFPYEPTVALWTAVLAVRSGTPSVDTLGNELEIATREWPELWNVLTVDPLFRPYVAPPRPTPPVLPAELSERLQLWNVIEIVPEPGSGGANISLGTYCPEPMDFDNHPLFSLRDTVGQIDLFEMRERAPPFRIEVAQEADRFAGRYDHDVLEFLKSVAPHCADSWFFLRDINHPYTDEIYLRGGSYGFRRWSLADVDSDPDGPMIHEDFALLRRLGQRPEARFDSAEFQRFLRTIR